jgi:hypothetical protein
MAIKKAQENDTRKFEVKKLIISGFIALLVGVIGNAVWKYYDKHYNKEVVNSFLLTLNPLEGSTRKTLFMKFFSDMTGEAKNGELTYEIKDILFQPNDRLVFTLSSEKWCLELNGYYNQYSGIVFGKKNKVEPIFSGWEAEMKK